MSVALPSAPVRADIIAQVADVAAERGRHEVQDEDRRADDEHEQRQHDREHHVDVREPLDALRDPGDRGEHEGHGEHGDDADQHARCRWCRCRPTMSRPLRICRAPRPSEAAEPNSVAKIASMSMTLPPGPLRVLAEQRLERRGDQLQAALAVDAVGDREADDGVDGPRVQRPVEQRRGHRRLRRGGVAGRAGAGGRRREVADRLAHAVEHQPDAHAGAEHHRDPGDRLELRLLAVPAERDVAVAAHRQPQHEDHEAAGGQRRRATRCWPWSRRASRPRRWPASRCSRSPRRGTARR